MRLSLFIALLLLQVSPAAFAATPLQKHVTRLIRETYYTDLLKAKFPQGPADSEIETILLEVAEEKRAKAESVFNLKFRDLILVSLGDLYHWLGHHAEAYGELEKASHYHRLSWQTYQQATLRTSVGIGGLDTLNHAELHLTMLAHGQSLTCYFYYLKADEAEHEQNSNSLQMMDAYMESLRFLESPSNRRLTVIEPCARWILERVPAGLTSASRIQLKTLEASGGESERTASP